MTKRSCGKDTRFVHSTRLILENAFLHQRGVRTEERSSLAYGRALIWILNQVKH